MSRLQNPDAGVDSTWRGSLMLNALRAVWDRRKSLLCALLALAPLSCASLEEESLEGVKVTNLPVVSYPVAWMDNERILMRYSNGDSVSYSGGSRKAIFYWVSYNYKTAERQNYGRVGTSPCYRDGYVSHYMTDDEDSKQLIAVYGELGKETRRRVEKGEIWFDNAARGSCRPWSEVRKDRLGRARKPRSGFFGLVSDLSIVKRNS